MADCICILVNLIVEGEPIQVQVIPNGSIIGGAPQFEGDIGETQLYIEYDLDNQQWIMYVGDDPFFAFFVGNNEVCPFGNWVIIPVFANTGTATFVETIECINPTSIAVVNCFDEELSFDFVPTEGAELNLGNVVSLDLNVGDPIVIADNNLCINDFTITHPEVNNGNPITIINVIAFEQVDLWNGRPYYLLTLTETEHGVPFLILNYYFLWSISDNRWEMWPEFNLIDGPSNSNPGCENVPYMVLGPGSLAPPSTECIGDPIASDFCSWGTVADCEIKVAGTREQRFCQDEIIIGDFVNCWQVVGFVETNLTQPTLSVTDEHNNCEDCLPRCLEFINCETQESIFYLQTEILLPYINQVIQIEIDGVIVCYRIRCAEDCLSGLPEFTQEILNSFVECVDCLPVVVDLTPRARAVLPGYSTGECDPELVEKAFCAHADYLHQEVMSKRFKIKTCCAKDESEVLINYNLIKYKLLQSASPTPNECEPLCVSYVATIQLGFTATISYVDCLGVETVIEIDATQSVQVSSFCGLDNAPPILNVFQDGSLVNTYTIPFGEECVLESEELPEIG